MTVTKSNRIFLGIVTFAMALAGTGLTVSNHFELDAQIAAIAITLAACFSSAEITFLWGHKRYESANRLWRKIVIAVMLVVLVISMALAVYVELQLALNKLSNRSLAQDSALVVKESNGRNQRILGRQALKQIAEKTTDVTTWPFVVCYLITGLSSIVILAASSKQQTRIKGAGNILPANPQLKPLIQSKIGFASTDNIRAHYDPKGGGVSLWRGSNYLGYLKKTDLETLK